MYSQLAYGYIHYLILYLSCRVKKKKNVHTLNYYILTVGEPYSEQGRRGSINIACINREIVENTFFDVADDNGDLLPINVCGE